MFHPACPYGSTNTMRRTRDDSRREGQLFSAHAALAGVCHRWVSIAPNGDSENIAMPSAHVIQASCEHKAYKRPVSGAMDDNNNHETNGNSEPSPSDELRTRKQLPTVLCEDAIGSRVSAGVRRIENWSSQGHIMTCPAVFLEVECQSAFDCFKGIF